MKTYQRYISKSLIFFSSMLFIFFLLIESNIGFKWIFNIVNYFYLGLKTEKISGNWRDFTLKNIHFDIFGASIRADSMHFLINIKSLYKLITIIDKIEAKNLSIFFKKNKNFFLNNHEVLSDIKKNIIFKYPFIIKKLRIKKIFFNVKKEKVFLLNVLSGIEYKNNNLRIYSTCINNINIYSLPFKLNNAFVHNKKIINNKSINKKKLIIFFDKYLKKLKNMTRFNINFMNFKCKRLNFVNYNQKQTVSKIEFKAKIIKKIFKIHKLKAEFDYFKFSSSGAIFFKNNFFVDFSMNNKISIKSVQNNIQGLLYKKRIYNYSTNFKKTTFLKNLPSVYLKIQGHSNFKNLALDSIDLSFFNLNKNSNILNKENTKKKIFYKSYSFLYKKYILNLIGKLSVFSNSRKNDYNLSIPKINLDAHIMKKKISILGSLYYKNFNFLKVPKINLFFGKNKLFFTGILGNDINISSDFYINHLNYFFPDLKGIVTGKINLKRHNPNLIFSSVILGKNIYWNFINLNSIKILTRVSNEKNFLRNTSINIKNIYFNNYFINSINFNVDWNSTNQKFNLFIKNKDININLIINSKIDHQSNNWHGYFKKINIITSFGKLIIKNHPLLNYIYSNKNNGYNFKTNFLKKNKLSYFFYNFKNILFNIFHKFSLSIKSKLFINTKIIWILKKNTFNGKCTLIGKNTILKKMIQRKNTLEKINFFKLLVYLNHDSVFSRLIVTKSNNSLHKKNLFGFLKVVDIYNRQKIYGQFYLSHFSLYFMNFFVTNVKEVQGFVDGKIKVYGTMPQPKVLADIKLINFSIRDKNLLNYMSLFFHSFLIYLNYFQIDQEVTIKNNHIFFVLDSIKNRYTNIVWDLFFDENNIIFTIFGIIKLNLISKLDIHYFLSKYDIIGYIKSYLLNLNINEHNIIF